MKQRITVLLLLLLVHSLCGCAKAENNTVSDEPAVVSETEISVADTVPVTFSMGETEEELAAQQVEVDISEDSPMNLYGFPIGEQPYFIYVEKGSHSITIYTKDLYGFYTVEVGCWATGTGKTSSLTPTGIFTLGKKEKWHKWPSGNYSPYTTKYYENKKYGGLFIHAAVYGAKSFRYPYSNSLRGIGKDATSGCLRTTVQCAYFIYNYCESGTMIKIVNGSPLGKKAPGVIYSTQYTDPAVTGVGVKMPEQIELSDMSFEQERYVITVGTSQTIMPDFYPENSAYKSCVWTSSDEEIAVVENGVVKGIKPGTARITATYTLNGSINASYIVKVQVGNVVISQTDIEVELPDAYVPETENIIPFTSDMIAVKYKGTDVSINTLAQPFIDKLGDNYEYEEAESCAYNGMDKKYTYELEGGYVELSTIPLLDGEDTVCEVYVTGQGITTAGGIGIGDSVHDIEAVYGTDFTCETVSDYGREDCYMLLTYWAGEKNSPATPQLSFTLDPDTLEVTAFCAYSARNFG